jgi:hypothetical protein
MTTTQDVIRLSPRGKHPGPGDASPRDSRSRSRMQPTGRGGGNHNQTQNSSVTTNTTLKQAPTSQAQTLPDNSNHSDQKPMEIDNEHRPEPLPPTRHNRIDQTTPNNGSNTTPTNPRRSNTITYKHNYRMLIKAFPNDKEKDMTTRLHDIQIVLQALQTCDPNTFLVIPADDSFQQRIQQTEIIVKEQRGTSKNREPGADQHQRNNCRQHSNILEHNILYHEETQRNESDTTRKV